MKLSEEHQFGRVISQTTSGNWYEVRTGRTINHQKLKVRTEKPYDNRNTKDIVSLGLKKCGTVRLYRITKDIAISGIVIASFYCINDL